MTAAKRNRPAHGTPLDSEDAYISVTEAQARDRRALKHNDTFAVLDAHGDINAFHHGSDGLFHCDTRFLSYLTVTLHGQDLLLLGSNLSADGTYLRSDLTNPDIYQNGEIVLLKDQVHCERTTYVRGGLLRQQVTVSNYGQEAIEVTLAVGFENDFADLFEVRGMHRATRGTFDRRVSGPCQVSYSYRGLDDVVRGVTIAFDPAPAHLNPTIATYHLTIGPRGRSGILIEVACGSGSIRRPAFLPGILEARREFRRQRSALPDVETGDAAFNDGPSPVERRPCAADDGDSRGTLPLRGHTLVLDRVWS